MTGLTRRPTTVRNVRVLVTGSSGFVGRHLVDHLRSFGDEVVEWSGHADTPDVRDRGAMIDAVGDQHFDGVFHLAAQSRVDLSWQDPVETLAINAGGTANLIDALAASPGSPRLILMSSAEVYGLVDAAALPVTEEARCAPRTPYGVSKLAAETLALTLAGHRGVDTIVCRPFNQIGPGQSDAFVASAFARQIVDNERRSSGEPVIRVGNLSATRDFLDVRDAVVAYRQLLIAGVPGEVYNVASGVETQVSALLDGLCAHSTVDQQVEVDPARLRPSDMPRFAGSIARIGAATGWRPRRPLAETLGDIVSWWRDQPAQSGAES